MVAKLNLNLNLSATPAKTTALCSPRETPWASPRLLRRTKAVSKPTKLRAVQSPVPLSSLQLVPSRSEIQDLGGRDAIIVELRSQLEDIWHEYASARKRNLTLLEESETLTSQVRRLNAEVCEEQYHRKLAEERLQAAMQKLDQLKEALDGCHL